ncbi:helix-turn-helix domain-containing protein [Marinicella sp. NBU2979]|uniref:helix-turn-helix transcriptional regulator n=1 Tax=Marinicella meishanensis TaxID=2873263 RepID=UPI001CC0A870
MKHETTERSYSTKEVCWIFSIHKSTARRWVHSGLLPQPITIGRSVRFLKSEIDQVIEQRKMRRPS